MPSRQLARRHVRTRTDHRYDHDHDHGSEYAINLYAAHSIDASRDGRIIGVYDYDISRDPLVGSSNFTRRGVLIDVRAAIDAELGDRPDVQPVRNVPIPNADVDRDDDYWRSLLASHR